MESIEAHLNKLKTTWQEFIMNMETSGGVNVAISALEKLVETLDFLVNRTPMATIAVTGLTLALGKLALVKMYDAGTKIIKFTSDLKKAGALADDVGILTKFLNVFGTRAAKATEATDELGNVAGVSGKVAFSAAGGFSKFAGSIGSLFVAIAPVLLAVAALGVGIYALDKVIVTNKELQEQIDTTKDNIETLTGEIESNSTAVKENADRLAELKKLMADGSATDAQKKEAAALENTNQKLKENLAIQERKLALEKEDLKEKNDKKFKRQWESAQGLEGDYEDGAFDSSGNQKFAQGEDLFAHKIKIHNKLVASYENERQMLLKMSKDQTKSKDDIDKQQKKMDAAKKAAMDSEKTMLGELSDLEEARADGLSKKYDDVAKNMIDAFGNVKMVDNPFENYADYLAGLQEDTADGVEAVSTLIDTFKELYDVNIKPSDASSMEDFLKSLEETDLFNLQMALEGLGNQAVDFVDIFNSMDTNTALEYLNLTVKEFTGSVNTASTAYSEFKGLVEKDFDSGTRGIEEMVQYYQDSMKKGVENQGAFNSAKDALTDPVKGLSEATTTIQNWRKYVKDGAFDAKNFRDAVTSAGDAIVSIGQDGSISIKDFSALSGHLGITDEMLDALILSMERYGGVVERTQSTALQEGLKGAREEITKTDNAISGLITQYADYTERATVGKTRTSEKLELKVDVDLGSTVESTGKTVQETLDAQIQEIRGSLDRVAKGSGLKIKFPIQPDSSATEEELRAYYNETMTALTTYQTLISQYIDNQGNWDFSSLGDKIFGDGIKVDMNNKTITVDNVDKIQEQVASQLSNGIEDVDLQGQILANMFSEGWAIQLPEAEITNTEDFASNVSGKLGASVTKAVTAESSAWSESALTALGTIEAQGKSVSESVQKNILDTLTSLNGKNYEGKYFSTLDNTAKTAKTTVTSIKKMLDTIASTTYTGRITYQTSGSTQPPKAQSANGREMPKYANGKTSNMGTPLRQEHGSNSMVGEEGFEYVVDKNGNTRVVGKNGAEFVKLNAGDTVLPHDVSAMIKSGRFGTYSGGKTSTGSTNWGNASGKVNIGEVTSRYGTSGRESQSSSRNNSKTSSSKTSKNTSGNSKNSSGGTSEDSKANVDAVKEAAENEIKILKHKLNMEYITQKQYYTALDAINKKYYLNKEKYQSEDWAIQEELYTLQKKFSDEWLATQEHKITILERSGGAEQQQMEVYRRMQNQVHYLANEYRKRGFGDDSKEIQDLQKQWWGYYDNIRELQNQMFEEMIEDADHYLSILDSKLDRMPEFVDKLEGSFGDLLVSGRAYIDEYTSYAEQKVIQLYNQKALTQARINELAQEGYEKNKKQIQSLTKQMEDYDAAVISVYESLKEMAVSSLETQRDRQDLLHGAVKDYVGDEISALEKKKKLLQEAHKVEEDNLKIAELQDNLAKAQLNYNNALKRGTRVYYADKGFVWEANADDIKAAANEVKEAQKAIEDFNYQKQLDEIDSQIDKWNDYLQKWEDATGVYDKESRAQAAILEWGKDWQHQILNDMQSNLGLTLDNSVGLLQTFRDEYVSIMKELAEYSKLVSLEDLEGKFNLDTSVPNTSSGGVTYDKNTDYQALINSTKAEIERQKKEHGTYDTTYDRLIEMYEQKRAAKMEGEGLNNSGQKVNGSSGSSSSSGGHVNSKDASLGQSSQNAIKDAQTAYNTAKANGDKAGMAAAHAKAESIRNQNGYSGGADGSKVSSYASGGVVDYTGGAMVHGSPSSSEVVFNAQDAKKLWNTIHNSDTFLSDIFVKMMNKVTSIFDSGSDDSKTIDQSITIGNISLNSVKNGNDFVRELKLISMNR